MSIWPASPDHQVALILAVTALIGALIWIVRAVRNAPTWPSEPSHLDQHDAPEYESWAHRTWDEADDEALTELLRGTDKPYDWKRDEGSGLR